MIRPMRPLRPDYTTHVRTAAVAFLADDAEGGRAALGPIAYLLGKKSPRPKLREADQAVIYERDSWTCRYCGTKLVLRPILELVAALCPAELPYLNDHMPADKTHPVFLEQTPVIDHRDPGARSGRWLDKDNLLTACDPCNRSKGDFSLEALGWEPIPPPDPTWDGMVPLYRKLWEAAGQPQRGYHDAWMGALRA